MTLESKQISAYRKRITESQAKFKTPHVMTVRALLEGDHWMRGEGWVGPRPPTSDEKAAEVMTMIERIFVSQNLVEEVATRHRDSVAGEEPQWGMTVARELGTVVIEGVTKPEEPTEDERALILEADTALTRWWATHDVWTEVGIAALHAIAIGKGVLRLYIPASATVPGEDGEPEIPRGSLEEIIPRIFLEAADPYSSGELRNRDRVLEGAYYSFTDDANRTRLELQRIENGDTIIAVETAKANAFAEVTYPLGGALMLFEMRRLPIITPQIVSQQKLINKTHTMLSRNADAAGFVERTILNSQRPGRWVPDPDRPGEELFIPSPYQVGSGITNFLAPYTIDGDATQPKVAIPADVKYRDPVDVNVFVDSVASSVKTVYLEAKQSHMLIAGDATASGRSREQAVNEYRSSLKPTKTQIERAVAWMLETTLKLAAYFGGNATRFDTLRAAVNVNVAVTHPGAEDIRADIELNKNGLMSQETVMLRSGRISDPVAEKARLKLERIEARNLGDPNVLRDSVANAVTAGLLSQRAGLIELGHTPERADQIVREAIQEALERDTGITEPALLELPAPNPN